jgi:dTDP-4-dehydrorhamnose reductase
VWLIFGGHGQLGTCLQLALSEHGIEYKTVGREEVDITNMHDISVMMKNMEPSVVVNAAAWTAVDKAEDEEDAAYVVNCLGAGRVAVAAAAHQATCVHVSTDYVLSGISQTPFEATDTPAPVGAYGRTKLAGENAVRLAHPNKSLIVRTAWLYSSYKSNFARTMVRKALHNAPVRVVNDQLGQPTFASDLAHHIIELVGAQAPANIYHGTNSGEATWFEFAQEIFRLVGADTSLVSPVPTSEYPTRATRPAYSVLGHATTHQLGINAMRPWKDALTESLPHIVATIEQE